MFRQRRGQRGFTLVELGIVVAVIGILATVVMVGRGYLLSARVAKTLEAIGVVETAVSTYSGLQGGSLPAGTDLALLQTRNLLANATLAPAGGFTIANMVLLGAAAPYFQYSIDVACPDAASATDIQNAKSTDPNVTGTAIAGTTVTLTINL